MFNVEKAINDYRQYSRELTDNGNVYSIKGNINVLDKLSLLENLSVVDAITKSRLFSNHKRVFLVPALDLKRAELLIKKNEVYISNFINFINSKTFNDLYFSSLEKYIEYVSKNYQLESFEALNALIENKICLNTLINVAKSRNRNNSAVNNLPKLTNRAVR